MSTFMHSTCRFLLIGLTAFVIATLSCRPAVAEEEATSTESEKEEIGVSRSMEKWSIYLSDKKIVFRKTEIDNNPFLKEGESRIGNYDVELKPKEKEMALAIFRKAAEWEDHAIETDAPTFSKEFPEMKWKGATITFTWHENAYSRANPDNSVALLFVPNFCELPLSDVRMFLVLSKYLPAMEKELAQRQADAKALRDTFK